MYKYHSIYNWPYIYWFYLLFSPVTPTDNRRVEKTLISDLLREVQQSNISGDLCYDDTDACTIMCFERKEI